MKEYIEEKYVKPMSVTYRCYYCLEHHMSRVCEMHVNSDQYYEPSGCPYYTNKGGLKPHFIKIPYITEDVLDNPRLALWKRNNNAVVQTIRKLEETLEYLKELDSNA